MSHCANYILRIGGETLTAATRWGSQTLPADVFFGPKHTFDFLERLLEDGRGSLYDELMCEGAALVDYDRQRLLVFGGEDLRSDNALQRVYVAMLRLAWPGWTIDWAHGGLAVIATEAGLSVPLMEPDETPVLRPLEPWMPHQEVWMRDPNTGVYAWCPDEDAWGRAVEPDMLYFNRGDGPLTLITLRGNDGAVRDVGVRISAWRLLAMGPAILGSVRELPPLRLVPAAQGAEGGAFIDEGHRALHCWLPTCGPSRPASNYRAICDAWMGWRIERRVGGVPEQVTLSGRDPGPVEISAHVLVEYLVESLFSDHASAGINLLIAELREKASKPGVTLAPGALENPRPAMNAEDRRLFLQDVVTRLLSAESA